MLRRILSKLGLARADAVKPHTICFVISSPRSGTTWLKQALGAHPEVFSTENRLFGQFFAMWPERDGSERPRITLDAYVHIASEYYDYSALGLSRTEFEERLLESYLHALMELSFRLSGKRVVADKITPYADTAKTVITSIRRYFPGARIVQLVRDGRDVLTSGVFDWLGRNDHDKPRYASFVERRPDLSLARFFCDDDINIWARRWLGPLVALEDLAGGIVTVRYEDMLRNQAGVLQRVFEYLEVNASAEVVSHCVEEATFKKMSGGRERGEEVATAMNGTRNGT